MPLSARTELVEWFAGLARERELAHGYLLVGRDSVWLAEVSRAALRAVDGEHRLQLADGVIVERGEEDSSIGIKVVNDHVRPHLASFPGVAAYRVALVLGAELLTTEAQNALLKVAEEPPEHSVLLLATTDEERILPTLRSRLQRVAVPPLQDIEVAAWLREVHGVEADHAARVASHSGGSLALAAEQVADAPARACAEELLASPASAVPGIAKEAAAAEIPLLEILRALSVLLAYNARTARNVELWHRTQSLIRQAQVSPLNLRLQLAALFANLPND